jgi:hypothetical protein
MSISFDMRAHRHSHAISLHPQIVGVAAAAQSLADAGRRS